MWKDTLRIAGAYVAYVIGSGFATGQEIVQFFTVYGIKGIAGMLVCTVLFAAMGSTLLADGFRYGNGEISKLQNSRYKKRTLNKPENKVDNIGGVYEYYCGSALGKVFELLMPIILFCTVVIMIAGAGAAAREYYGFDYQVGCTAMAFILFLSYMLGFYKIVNAIGFLAPVIIIFMITVGILTIANSGAGSFTEILLQFDVMEKSIDTETLTSGEGIYSLKWLFSAMLYASYNTVSAVAFFRALGSSAVSISSAKAGGILLL